VNTKLEHPCEDCGTPVSLRRKRCTDCKREHHAKVMRDRRAAESGQESFDPQRLPLGQTLIDYTVPGAASRPPMHDIHPRPRRELVTDEEVIDYTKGGRSRPGIYERRAPLDGVPGHIRRDLVQAQTMARDLAADDEPELTSWDHVQASEPGRMVNFGQPMDGSTLRHEPGPRITNQAAAGQLYGPPRVPVAAVLGEVAVGPRPRPIRGDGQQRTPHIVN
jgi:hypothetical protein